MQKEATILRTCLIPDKELLGCALWDLSGLPFEGQILTPYQTLLSKLGGKLETQFVI